MHAREPAVCPVVATAQIKSAVGEKIGKDASNMEVKNYKKQVVAGMNYRLHVEIDGAAYTVVAFKPLPHTGNPIEVQSVEEGLAAF